MKNLSYINTFLIALSFAIVSCKSNVEVQEDIIETDEEAYEAEVAVNSNFVQYDLNNDGLWNTNEFSEAYQEDLSNYDMDRDSFLNSSEFFKTSFGWIDTDDDGIIDEPEWKQGFDNLYGDYNGIEYFDLYDLNDNELLDESEWDKGWGDSSWFADNDLNEDELMNEEEWNKWLFKNWDKSEDGSWDENEFNSFSKYYETWE